MALHAPKRWISWLWPMRATQAVGRFGPLEVRWEAGQLVLNSDHGNQSFGSLHRVWQRVFEHIDVATQPPASILMLGLGGGSVPRIMRHELGVEAPITAVEIDPMMVSLANTYFGLGAYADLTVITGDAIVQVHADTRRYDLVVVDLFEDLDLARGVDTRGFAHALRDRCGGTLCFNTVDHDARSAQRCQRVHDHLAAVFPSVDEFWLEGVNRVFIAR